jgi:hypothetical protein
VARLSLAGLLLSQNNQGLARFFLADLEGAEEAFTAALSGYRDTIGEGLIAHGLRGQAAAAARRGNLMRAALLAGAATRHTRGSPHDREQAVWARLDNEILAPARASSDREAWDDHERRGRALTEADALALACRRT